jgi:hypothetical protein
MNPALADARPQCGVAAACGVYIDVLDSNERGDEPRRMASTKRRRRGPRRPERQIEIA